ncbi:hypothetical protein [Kutzneria buriramensis]|uniref:Uncharacterized protein n=1 Tax=Kutzneria buriramensis TaxID=1045776 RepID=A0A3E0GW40_9PSEU|nr:hypothetical protein [Kutzneria buriramensis]REH29624.1 hypothetical protein BCF44_12451 [Kutzneria buriramensis]
MPEWISRRRQLIPLAAGVVGALLGAGSGWFWTAVTDHIHHQCAVEGPSTWCWLGGFIWGPGMVAAAMIVVALVVGLGLAVCEVWGAEAVAVWGSLLTFGAAWAFETLPVDSWTRFLVPAAILGGGLGVAVLLVEATTRWRRSMSRRPDSER